MGKKSHVEYRSSVNGRFVKSSYAAQHPKTTDREHVPDPGQSITKPGKPPKKGS